MYQHYTPQQHNVLFVILLVNSIIQPCRDLLPEARRMTYLFNQNL